MFTLYFHLDANIGSKKSHRKYVVVQEGGAASQVWYHLLAFYGSQRMNERFDKYLGPFVNLCHAREHKPTSVLLVSTMWCDGGENVGTIDMYEKTFGIGGIFLKGCQLCDILDPVFGSV